MDSEEDKLQILEHRVQALERSTLSYNNSAAGTHPRGRRKSTLEILEEQQILREKYWQAQKECSPALSVLRRHVEDFWNNISLPGLKYVGEPGRHRSDRFIWILVFFLSVLVSCRYIQDTYNKWKGSPVLLSFNDSLTHISLIPFPAVTLCPSRRLQDEDALQDIFDRCNQDNCTDNERNILSSARLLCPDSIKLNENGTTFYEGSVMEPLQEVSVDCEKIIKWFKFGVNLFYYNVQGNRSICSLFFQKVYRDGGRVCYTYNMLPAADIFKEDVEYPVIDDTGFEKKKYWSTDYMLETADLNISTIPRHTESRGRWAGFYFSAVNYTMDKSKLCNNRQEHTKIIVHHPGELPTEYSHESLTLTPNKDVTVRLKPNLVIASDELVEGYTPQDRRCYFAHEKKLSLFKMYTRRNCETECRVNCSKALCDCVPFFLPRLNSSKVCGKEDKESCSGNLVTGYLEGRYTWRDILWDFKPITADWIQDKFKEYQTAGFNNGTELTDEILEETKPCVCDCPAACNTLDYDLLVEENYYSATHYMSRININFKDPEVTSVLRKELIGFTDFIANSGGVLGVFTGFSFLALCELFYYVTFRLWTTIKHAWDDETDTVVRHEEKLKCFFCCGPVVVD